MVHLGPGAFFRAFNAVYTHEAMTAEGGDWGIVAVSLRSPTAHDQLDPQGSVYHSVTLSSEGPKPQLIGSVVRTLVAPDDSGAVVAAMADPSVKIVSLTITEKGYCHKPSDGKLNLQHPDIAHDLKALSQPVSAIGFIVAALAARRAAGDAAFTVLSCDNLPSNGALARGMVLEFAQNVDADLAAWIEAHVRFPSSMVDRITPATTDEDIAALSQITGTLDLGCVFHESFRQWVVEDDFANERPAWDAVGVQFVSSVDAHELMKLRCLNGTHSTLAYLGYLAGFETIAETVADPDFAALCEMLWKDEIIPTLPQPDGEDLPAYCATLMARYKDTSIRHRTWQIAMDGSQKLPQRLLGTIADNLAMGQSAPCLYLAVAAWMVYVGGVDENGGDIDVRDPLADALKAASDSAKDASGKVDAILAFPAIFPDTLARNTKFRDGVVAAYDALAKDGAVAAVRRMIRA
jgi:fructuronate reductase